MEKEKSERTPSQNHRSLLIIAPPAKKCLAKKETPARQAKDLSARRECPLLARLENAFPDRIENPFSSRQVILIGRRRIMAPLCTARKKISY